MRGEWTETTLGEIIDITHGFAFKGEFIHEEPREDRLLTPGNFSIGGGFKGDKFKYYDGPVPEEFVLCEGDLLVTMTDLSKQADTLGYPAFVPAPANGCRYLHNQRLGKISPKRASEFDLKYVYYVMCGKEYRHEVLASATGTTVKHTSPERLRQFRFLIPPLAEQRAIAHILGTLDDKIELNRRMSETLEAMSRALFKSWFVDFDPVRSKMVGSDTALAHEVAALFPSEFVDSETGDIPRGWTAKAFEDVMEINPPRRLRKAQTAPYLDMANMPTKEHAPMGWTERPFGSGVRFVNGDTLLARITPCLENGKTAYVDFLEADQVGWGSTEYIVLRPKSPLPSEFGYFLARSSGFREFAIQCMTGSSGRQRVPVQALSQYRVAVPPGSVAENFGRLVRPLVRRASGAVRETRVLSALRDTLLPKLISGEVRVNQMERATA